MIIASALGRLFNGLQIVYNEVNVGINYGYGDQKELLAWITSQDKANVRKYPLVWYVLNDFTEYQDWYETNVNLYIMQNTESEWFNPKRQEESYTKIIDPTWQKVKGALNSTSYVDVISSEPKSRFQLLDLPNYGVDRSNPNTQANDFTRKATKANQQIVTDIVDARLVKFKARIKTKCII